MMRGPTRARRWATAAVLLSLPLLIGWADQAAPAQPVPVQEVPAQDGPLQEEATKAIKVEVLVLHASNQGKGVDPAIGKLPELGEPPFSSYDTYKLLARTPLSLEKNVAGSTTLPNKSDLAVTYKGAAPPADKKPRYSLSASIKKPGGESALRLLEVNAPAGKYFFVAGQPHDGGILVIGIKVVN
jgi:hypothetical protein